MLDADLKRLISQHGPCGPGGTFECIKEVGSVFTNFRARYFNKDIKNISVRSYGFVFPSMEILEKLQ